MVIHRSTKFFGHRHSGSGGMKWLKSKIIHALA